MMLGFCWCLSLFVVFFSCTFLSYLFACFVSIFCCWVGSDKACFADIPRLAFCKHSYVPGAMVAVSVGAGSCFWYQPGGKHGTACPPWRVSFHDVSRST